MLDNDIIENENKSKHLGKKSVVDWLKHFENKDYETYNRSARVQV